MAMKPRSDPRRGQDIELIRALAAVLDEAGLTEIEIGEGEGRIRIARKPAPAAPASPPPAAVQPAPAPAPPVDAPPPAPGADDASHPGAVISPLVGVVYVAPEPGGRPFAVVGDEIGEGDTLFIVEAMKTMNPVRAPRSGRVARILAENGARVEYGEVLLILE
jgi:acetyl-CoA carboxylase biotin carboxyl carrier protein